MRSGNQQIVLYGDAEDIRGVIEFSLSRDGEGKETGHHNIGVLFKPKARKKGGKLRVVFRDAPSPCFLFLRMTTAPSTLGATLRA